MKNIILTGKTKFVNGTEVFQIKASDDIPQFGISKGDIGGWICKETELEDSWVDQSSSLINGHAERSQILKNSDVSDCEVLESKLEQVSGYDSKIHSVLAVNSVIRDSSVYVAPHEADTKYRHHIQVHNAKIVQSEIASTCKTISANVVCSININRSTLDTCSVKGKDILILGCKYPIYNTSVEGTNIKLKWIDYLTATSVIGKDIWIEHFNSIDSTKITVDEMVADGKKSSNIYNSSLEALYVKIMGHVNLKKIEVSRSRRFVVEGLGENVSDLRNCSFSRRVLIQGEHSLKQVKITSGITLKGKSNVENVFADEGIVRLSGDIDVVNVNMVGKDIRIEDMASVRGQEDKRIELGEDTRICEFATVTNQESGFSIKLEDTTVNGESVITS
ncbi:hypothetical protein [Rossellomorea marisflavi]|uniref:hypothetical protein n=1 Tax=Rossellomorea marisflavi TaxID=189381 RepID=UPI003FA0B909